MLAYMELAYIGWNQVSLYTFRHAVFSNKWQSDKLHKQRLFAALAMEIQRDGNGLAWSVSSVLALPFRKVHGAHFLM